MPAEGFFDTQDSRADVHLAHSIDDGVVHGIDQKMSRSSLVSQQRQRCGGLTWRAWMCWPISCYQHLLLSPGPGPGPFSMSTETHYGSWIKAILHSIGGVGHFPESIANTSNLLNTRLHKREGLPVNCCLCICSCQPRPDVVQRKPLPLPSNAASISFRTKASTIIVFTTLHHNPTFRTGTIHHRAPLRVASHE